MDKKQLNKETIGPIVDAKVSEAVGWFNSKLSTERERVTRFYNGELPKRQNSGSSSFVSTDVYDAVESMKAQLLETFAAGKDIVRFDPSGDQDVAPAAIATLYTSYVVFQQNNGYSILSDTIHDGLTARVGVAKVYWEENESETDEEFDDHDQETAETLASHPDVSTFEATETGVGTGRFAGKLTRKTNKSQVRIEVINPEEFSVEPQARDLGPKTFCCHKTMKSRDELIKAGYDKADVDACIDDDTMSLMSQPEVIARFQEIDSGISNLGQDDVQDETKLLVVTEAFIQLQLDGDDYAKCYKVVKVGAVILDIEEVDEHPFVVFVPLPIPHSFYGNNFAARVIPTQNATTSLTRAILDHTAITTNPRLTVLKGGLTNPRELLDNRLGGIVNITRPDAVQPLAQANLNPFVFQTLQLVQQKAEETTGISSLSKGLNKDAISKQNSQGMVEDLVSLSMTRQKIIARNFGNGFLVNLYIKVYNLVVAREDRKKIIDVAGNWVEVDPTRWTERRAATVSLHLGYGELEADAKKREAWATTISQDQQLNQCFQLPGRFALAKDVAKAQGIYNYLDYLTPPNKLPPPQPQPPNPEIVIKQREVAVKEMQAKTDAGKVQGHEQIEQLKLQMKQMEDRFNNEMKRRDEARKDSDVASRIDVAQREIAIAEHAAVTEERVIVAPR